VQEKLKKLNDSIGGKYGIPGVKLAMSYIGVNCGDCRLPLAPLSPKEKEEVKDIISSLK